MSNPCVHATKTLVPIHSVHVLFVESMFDDQNQVLPCAPLHTSPTCPSQGFSPSCFSTSLTDSDGEFSFHVKGTLSEMIMFKCRANVGSGLFTDEMFYSYHLTREGDCLGCLGKVRLGVFYSKLGPKTEAIRGLDLYLECIRLTL